MHKAIFLVLDRDGTINEDVGDFCSPEKLIFIPGAIEALRTLQERFLLFIITN
jgi:histidinol phosphatase-like enzyme